MSDVTLWLMRLIIIATIGVLVFGVIVEFRAMRDDLRQMRQDMRQARDDQRKRKGQADASGASNDG